MVRLKDIAERAGVSVMTVSKVLRDAPDISAQTKTRVRALAQQMGYVPDSMAQSLRTRKTRLFGLVISALTNPIFARVVMAIEERAAELGYDLLIAQSLNLPEREEQCIRRLLSRRVDGLFLSPVYRLGSHAPVYAELESKRVPVVLLGHRSAFCQSFINVETDDSQASYQLTRHLLELGHRRIAFLAGPAACPWARERLDGYRRALREAQLPLEDHLIFNAGATIDEGGKAALQMLQENAAPTAVQAVNDLVAIGASTVLLKQGLRIPKDLSVVGFGNILTSEHYRVPLTTVRQPKFRQGVVAIELMVQLLKGEHPDPRRLPAEIVYRDSTAPPPFTTHSPNTPPATPSAEPDPGPAALP